MSQSDFGPFAALLGGGCLIFFMVTFAIGIVIGIPDYRLTSAKTRSF